MELLSGLVSGVISGIITSVAFFFAIQHFKPKLEILGKISVYKDSDKTNSEGLAFKLINHSYQSIMDLQVDIYIDLVDRSSGISHTRRFMVDCLEYDRIVGKKIRNDKGRLDNVVRIGISYPSYVRAMAECRLLEEHLQRAGRPIGKLVILVSGRHPVSGVPTRKESDFAPGLGPIVYGEFKVGETCNIVKALPPADFTLEKRIEQKLLQLKEARRNQQRHPTDWFDQDTA